MSRSRGVAAKPNPTPEDRKTPGEKKKRGQKEQTGRRIGECDLKERDGLRQSIQGELCVYLVWLSTTDERAFDMVLVSPISVDSASQSACIVDGTLKDHLTTHIYSGFGYWANCNQTLLIPASISLVLYVLISFVLVPFLRHHYVQRYAHYLPLDTISAHTSTVRDRIGDAVVRCVVRSSARLRRRGSSVHIDNYERDGGDDGLRDNNSIGDEEGEIMVGMPMGRERRAALEDRFSRGGGYGHARDERRLSRELEEGFMDDSDGS